MISQDTPEAELEKQLQRLIDNGAPSISIQTKSGEAYNGMPVELANGWLRVVICNPESEFSATWLVRATEIEVIGLSCVTWQAIAGQSIAASVEAGEDDEPPTAPVLA